MNARAFADMYSVSLIDVYEIKNTVAIDDFGDYTVLVGTPLNPGFYTHYVDGTNVVSATAPTLLSDPNPLAGTDPCAMTAPGFSGHLICNNGHVLFGGLYEDPYGALVEGLWSGSNPDPTLNLSPGGAYFELGIMSANGNALLEDTRNDKFYVAIDEGPSPVPEPNSLILLGTGALSLFGVVRRKRLNIL